MQDVKESISLKCRPFDWLLIVSFSFFVCSSFFVSSFNALNIPLTPESKNFLVQAIYFYGSTIDPLYIINPIFCQIQNFIDTFIFGPFYLLLIYTLVTGKNWIRVPAIIYASVIAYSLILYFGVELFGDYPPINYSKFFAMNLPYLLVPLLLGYRMRHPYPFSNNSIVKN